MYKEEKEKPVMQEKHDPVPFIVYEGTQARNERTVKRLMIALIVSICLLFVSNMAWLHFLSSSDIQSYEYTQDGQGVNVLGDGNGVEYDVSAAQGSSDTPEKQNESEESHRQEG